MLREPEERALRAAHEPILAIGDDGHIAFANAAALALLGWDGSLVGQPMSAIIPPQLRAAQSQAYGRFTASRRARGRFPSVQPARGQDGADRPLLVDVLAFHRPDGGLFMCMSLAAPDGEAPGLAEFRIALSKAGYAKVPRHH